MWMMTASDSRDRGPVRAVTHDEIEAFRVDGVVCLRGVLDPEVVMAMAADVDAALDGVETADMSALAEALEPTGAASDRPTGGFRSGVDHWRTRGAFREFALDTAVPAVVGALLGSSRVRLYEDSVLAKEPGAVHRTVWHQDLGSFNLDGEQLVTTWVPLDLATSDSGAMRFVRGSHRWGQVFRPNLFVSNEPIPGTEGEIVPDIDGDPGAYDLVSFDLGPGDLTVHHARTLHAAGPNTSDRRRRAISIRYCGDDARFHRRPGTVLKDYQRALTDGDELPEAESPTAWPTGAGGSIRGGRR